LARRHRRKGLAGGEHYDFVIFQDSLLLFVEVTWAFQKLTSRVMASRVTLREHRTAFDRFVPCDRAPLYEAKVRSVHKNGGTPWVWCKIEGAEIDFCPWNLAPPKFNGTARFVPDPPFNDGKVIRLYHVADSSHGDVVAHGGSVAPPSKAGTA
jgi:hypothetical protein